jgi:hypothetical protein
MPRRTRLPFVAIAAAALMLAGTGCKLDRRAEPPDMELRVIADSIERLMRSATDLSQPNVVRRMLALYPDRGQVISASGGRVTTTRDSLVLGIRAFWQNVGRNMHEAKWVWDTVYVDVPSTRAAVFTGTYRIPHRTPAGLAHEIGGAWTAAFAKRDGRWVIVQEHLSDWPAVAESPADSLADAEARKRQGEPVAAPTDHTRH